jgi:hypothetical protein
MDVNRFPKPTSWTMLLEQARYVKSNPSICQTYVIDTADWAEQLCTEYVCSNKLPPKGKETITGIEDFGYGKGYTYLAEEFGRLLNLLSEIIGLGVNVVLTAHAAMRKFEQPDELGQYDRWEMKLQKKVYPLVKEWADMVLFCNYKTYVVNVDNQGAQKGRNKAQGGSRVMFSSHHPCWDAKNRHNLAEELPLEYEQIAHCIPVRGTAPAQQPTRAPEPKPEPAAVQPPPAQAPVQAPAQPAGINPAIPKPLANLMTANSVTEAEIQKAVASKGYYPADTPIENYDPQFINGVLVGAWAQVFKMVQDGRQVVMNLADVPFK